jgi:hypothetical protein
MYATASGGTAPYSFQWSNGVSNYYIGNLTAGFYTVTVTDDVGATASSSAVINPSNNFWANLNYSAPTPGKCNGLIFFNPWCIGNNASSNFTYYDGYNFIEPVCHQSTVTHQAYTWPSSCPSNLNGLTVDANIYFTGPCHVIYNSTPQQIPCNSNTQFTVINQHPLPSLTLPSGNQLSSLPYFGWGTFKLSDLSGNVLATLNSPYEYLQHYDTVQIDFGLNITETVIFEYNEGFFQGDSVGIHLKDTFSLFQIECGSFNGKIFLDSNNDCVYNPGIDLPVPNSSIHVLPLNYNLITNDSGEFNLYLPFGNYSWTEVNPFGLLLSCSNQPSAFTIDSSNNVIYLEIADTSAGPLLCDLAVSTSSLAARPGFDVRYFCEVQNQQLLSADSSVMTLTYDTLLQFLNAEGNYSHFGYQISWDITSLDFQESNLRRANFHLPPQVQIGTTLNSIAEISSPACDTNMTNNIFNHQITVTGSFDPNDKAVVPVGAGPLNIIPSVQKLFYTIRFQNTGNDTAFRVIIIDTLHANLDINSFNFEMASHFCYLKINSSVLTVTFPDILLPDSSANNEGSNGFVTFSIDPVNGLSEWSAIHNEAAIYFDYNAPVITNTVTNTIKDGPVAQCQNITALIDSTGVISLSGNDLNNGSYDFYGIQSLVLSDSIFYCSQTGPNIITLIVSSLNGLTDSCQAEVLVIDSMPPFVICKDTILEIDSTCTVSILPSDVLNIAVDNCVSLQYGLSQDIFDCSDIGINNISVTVTDSSGNTSSCSSMITIIDITGFPPDHVALEIFDITPNPSEGIIHLPAAFLSCQISIFDLSGKALFHSGQIQNTELDLSSLPGGFYTLRVMNGNQVIHRRFVLE